MSSSSAMLIGFYLVLARVNRLFDREGHRSAIATLEDLAGYLGTVENGQSFKTLAGDKGVGTFGGSQDHTAILCSAPGKLRQYAFCPVRHERDVPLPADQLLAIAASGVIAEKTGAALSAYNDVSQRVSRLVALWNENTTRQSATLADVLASAPDAADRLRTMIAESTHGAADRQVLLDRLDQFVEEAYRIIPAVGDALTRGPLLDIGPLIDRSQEMTDRLLRNQTPETRRLAQSARALGAVAASAFGAGFGGGVWALIPSEDAEAFIERWREDYASAFPTPSPSAVFFITRAGPPACEVRD